MLLSALILTIILSSQAEIIFLEIPIFSSLNCSMNFVIILDQISSLFLFRVSLIRVSVLSFSKSYISNDKHFVRFHYLVLAFILSIYFLILRPNLVRVLLGWDGLGLRSYLLVIYYGSSKSYNSGIVTALTNRLGDSLILLRIGTLVIAGNWNFYFYSSIARRGEVLLLLILAASTKSAQIPFSAWLPAAMAAPTPVSSLVHSSTLVTAGVYLLIRHEYFFVNNHINIYILVIGAFTIRMASISALFETDLKKIVALSTLSQLGVIFLRLGLGAYLLSYFHLLTHAFFKALLFLATGAIIHRRKDYQDLRITGRSRSSLPTINSFILISRFSLIGLPFISAFFSKEIILEHIILKNFNIVIYIIIILGVALTAIYRARFIFLVFSRWVFNDLLTLKLEEDYYILKGIIILSLPAGLGGSWITLYLFRSLKLPVSYLILKICVFIVLISGGLLAVWYSAAYRNWDITYWRIRSIWSLPFIRTGVPNYTGFSIGNKFFKLLDRGSLAINKNFLVSVSQTRLSTSRVKFLRKLLTAVIIWLAVIYVFYLC